MLNKFNPTHKLLWVESGNDTEIHKLKDNFYRGEVPYFATYANADEYHPDGWTRLMTDMAADPEISQMIEHMIR